MDSTVVTFNQQGRDLYIDFLKAFAILCVLFAHTIPCLDEVGYGLWAGMQVPLFLLIQVFHATKTSKPLKVSRIISRIFVPFVISQILMMGGGNFT